MRALLFAAVCALALAGCKARTAPAPAPRTPPFDAEAFVRDFQAALPERLAILSVVDALWSKAQERDAEGFLRYVSRDFLAPGTAFPNYCALRGFLTPERLARIHGAPLSIVPNDTRVAGDRGLAMIDLRWTDDAGAEHRALGLQLRFRKEEGAWRVIEALPASGEALAEALGRAPPSPEDPLGGLSVETGSVEVAASGRPVLFADFARAGARPAYFELRNDGATAVESPRLLPDDGVDAFDRASFVRGAVRPEAEEAERALALFQAYTDRRYSYCNGVAEGDYLPEFHDPVKLLASYGYGCCGENATAFIRLLEAAGVRGRRVALGDHVVSEAFWGGAWRMLDADTRLFFARADGAVAGLADLVAEPALVARTLSPSGRTAAGHDGMLAQYADGARHEVDRLPPDEDAHTLRWTLRPGERITYYPLGLGAAYDAPPGPMRTANAVHEVELLPERFEAQKGAYAFENLRPSKEGGGFERIDAARPGAVTVHVDLPYVIVGAFLEADFRGGDVGSLWAEGRSGRTADLWTPLAATPEGEADGALFADFTEKARGLYRYAVRFEARGALRASALRVRTLAQVSPLSLPTLERPLRVLTGPPGASAPAAPGLTLSVGAYPAGEPDAACE